jgi:hypothetical protein
LAERDGFEPRHLSNFSSHSYAICTLTSHRRCNCRRTYSHIDAWTITRTARRLLWARTVRSATSVENSTSFRNRCSRAYGNTAARPRSHSRLEQGAQPLSKKVEPVFPRQERRSLQDFSSRHVDTHPLRAGFVWYNLNHGTWTDVLGCGSPAAA